MEFLRPKRASAGIDLAPLIDCVFLLLIFFMLTFKIASQEGDFNVKMPLSGQASSISDMTDLPIKLRLKADAGGGLTEIVVNDSQSFGKDWGKLRNHILQLTGNPVAPGEASGPEVEIDLDYNLRYEHVIAAITSVTGYKRGSDIIRLVDKIKFSPPRKPN